MLTLLHISDLHFGPPYVESIGEALLRFAAAMPAISSSPAATPPAGQRRQFRRRQGLSGPAAACSAGRDSRQPRHSALPGQRTPADALCPVSAVHFARPRNGSAASRCRNRRPQHHRTLASQYQRPHRSVQLDYCAKAFRDVPEGAARIVVASIIPLPRLATSTARGRT